MRPPIEELTPRQIVAELDRYIVGQDAAKRAVAVALRNRFRRQQLPEEERNDVMPKNILMIGPTGVGKTEIARRLAQLARAPFVKVEATKFTEVGYVGRDVESMVRELVAAAVRLVEHEKQEAAKAEIERRVLRRLAEQIDDERLMGAAPMFVEEPNDAFAEDGGEAESRFGEVRLTVEDGLAEEETPNVDREARLRAITEEIYAGKHDDHEVDVEVEEGGNPFVQVFTPGGMEEMGLDTNQLGGPFGNRRSYRRVSLREALPLLREEEGRRMIDRVAVHREAIERAEQTGIIFLDEIDKVAVRSGRSVGPDVSREGVQRDLLPIIEGSTVQTKFGPVRTDHILFIAAGAFHMSKPSDLIPELQGRLPIRVELEALSEVDFRRILMEPRNALVRQYQRLLEMDGVRVQFTDDAIDTIAHLASEVNKRTENIGARRLHTLMERLLEDLLYEAPEIDAKEITLDAERVNERLGALASSPSAARNVL